MGSEPEVIWVDSWRDIPAPDPDSSLRGYSDPKTGSIYAIKGVTTRGEIEHERFHSIKGHPESPRTYQSFIDHELEAYEYAYLRVGRPKHILMKLRAIFNDSIRYKGADPKGVRNYLRKKLFSLAIPDTWKDDYYKFEREFEKVYGK